MTLSSSVLVVSPHQDVDNESKDQVFTQDSPNRNLNKTPRTVGICLSLILVTYNVVQLLDHG